MSRAQKDVEASRAAAPRTPPLRELRSSTFRLPLPKGWSDRSVYCASQQMPDGQQATITVVAELLPVGDDLASFSEDQERQLAGQLADFSIILSERRMFGTRICRFLRFRWKPATSEAVQQSQWCVQHQNLVYTITATIPDGSPPNFESQMAEIIGAFAPSA